MEMWFLSISNVEGTASISCFQLSWRCSAMIKHICWFLMKTGGWRWCINSLWGDWKICFPSWGDCRAAWTAFVLQGSSLHCLWLSVPQLCVSGCREELLSHYPLLWEKGEGYSGHRLMCQERHKTEGEVWPEWNCCSSGGLIPRLERLSTTWNEIMDTSLQLSLSKVPPFSLVSSCITETCASLEQLHPLSWWKVLTCVRNFCCCNTCSLSFSFQQRCAAAKLPIISIKQHQWLLKAEIYLFGFLTILQIPYLQIHSLSRLKIQDNKLFFFPKFFLCWGCETCWGLWFWHLTWGNTPV